MKKGITYAIAATSLVILVELVHLTWPGSVPGRPGVKEEEKVTESAVPVAKLGPATGSRPGLAQSAEREELKPLIVRGPEKEKLIEDLADWATTYDRAAVQKIRKYVFSADPDVRGAAIDALVAAGVAEGADVLEEAMRSMSVPEEIVKTKEKVKFLRLPSALSE